MENSLGAFSDTGRMSFYSSRHSISNKDRRILCRLVSSNAPFINVLRDIQRNHHHLVSFRVRNLKYSLSLNLHLKHYSRSHEIFNKTINHTFQYHISDHIFYDFDKKYHLSSYFANINLF